MSHAFNARNGQKSSFLKSVFLQCVVHRLVCHLLVTNESILHSKNCESIIEGNSGVQYRLTRGQVMYNSLEWIGKKAGIFVS